MGAAALKALVDHSQKRLEPTAVMRALVQHDDWHVPIHALTRVPTGPVIAYAERDRSQVAPHQLNVFTDRAAADLATEKFGRAPMGTYVGPIEGTELFGNLVKAPALGPALMLQVNPGSPPELQWFVERTAFGLCEIWASAVLLERKIATSASGWDEAMKLYPGWLVVLGKTDNALVRINMREKGEHALVFSAPDLADNFLKGLPNNGGSACKTVAVSGVQLFKFVMKSGVKGFIVNASSAQTRVFDASVCRMILGLP
jgi:hypothetical protein